MGVALVLMHCLCPFDGLLCAIAGVMPLSWHRISIIAGVMPV